MSQKIQKFWDQQSGKYDRAEMQFDSIYQDIMTKTGKYLKDTDNVLDYGCATGTKTIAFASKVGHIHGVDISEGMIHEAMKKKNALQLENVSFAQGTIFNPEFEKATFDIIIAFAIIHLLEDKEQVLERINELLKPGGIFISTTACMKEKMDLKTKLQVISFQIMKRLGLVPLYLNRFTVSDVEKLFLDRGFEILETAKLTEGIPAVFIVARK